MMSTWTLAYESGSTGKTLKKSIEAETLMEASGIASDVLPKSGTFISLTKDDAAQIPTVVSANGTEWTICVDDAGIVTATPVGVSET